MPRKLLLFAAIAVVGSMLALWLATRGSSSAQPTPEPAQIASGEIDNRPQRTGERPSLPPSTDQTQPSATDQNPRDRRSADPNRPNAGTVTSIERGQNPNVPKEPPLEYTLPDGRRVRDFRDPANRKPLDVPPSIHPPGGRKIKPELTGLFTEQILAHMKECGKVVDKSALGAKPRLEGQIVIAIKKEQASISSVVFKLSDVTSAAVAETAKQCVEQKTLTVTVPAPGEADLDSYSINLSFAFP